MRVQVFSSKVEYWGGFLEIGYCSVFPIVSGRFYGETWNKVVMGIPLCPHLGKSWSQRYLWQGHAKGHFPSKIGISNGNL